MVEKRRIAVLVVALFLAMMPQGVYWLVPEGFDYDIGVPYYLFRPSAELAVEKASDTYLMDCGEAIGSELWHMRGVAYLYTLLALVLIGMSIYQIAKKKELQQSLNYTMKLFIGIAAVQLVGSIFYMKKYWVIVGDSYWMFGMRVIQLFLAIGVYVGTYGFVRPSKRNSEVEVWRQLIYVWLLVIGLHDVCFRSLPPIYSEGDILWTSGNMFFGDPFYNVDEDVTLLAFKIVSILFLVFAIAMMFVSEKIRVKFNERMHRAMSLVAVEYPAWICLAGVFSTPMQEPGFYFVPGVSHVILMSWSLWRLAGASEREV